VLWGATLMVVVGLVVNNIQRQFPVYWWTPVDLRRMRKGDEETVPDGLGGVEKKESKEQQKYDQDDERIEINGAEVVLPESLSLNAEETRVLERLQERLRERVDAKEKKHTRERDSSSARSSTEFTIVPTRSDRSGSTQDDR
jgi:hypothetical protein